MKTAKPIVYMLVFAMLICCFVAFDNSAPLLAEATYDFSTVGVSALPDGFQTDKLWYDSADYINIDALRTVVSGWADGGLLPDPTSPGFEPIKICVVDTGISLGHELYEGLYCYDENGTRITYDAYRGVQSATAAEDCDDHGSHVNGSIAILIKELGLQDYIKLLPVRATSTVVYSNGEPTYTFNAKHIIDAMEWAEAQGADVITMSLGSAGELSGSVWANAYMTSVMNRIENKILVLAAAGNDGESTDKEYHYPGHTDGFIGVMAYTKNQSGDRTLAGFSNYGDYDVASPGTSIYSATTYTSGGVSEYGMKQGTSMATPIAAAAAALLQLRYQYVETSYPGALVLSEIFRNHSETFITKRLSGYGNTETEISAVAALDVYRLLTADFDLSEMYAEPEKIELTVRGLLSQYPASLSDVVFSLEILPHTVSPDLTVSWYVDGEKAASGREFVYRPSGELGKTKIVGKVDGTSLKTEEYTVTVSYEPVLPSDCEIVVEKPLSEGRATLALSGAENADLTAVVWYVNGTEVARGVTTYEFNAKYGGSYLVSVTVGENTREFVVVVEDSDEKLPLLAVVACTLSVVFLAIGAVFKRKTEIAK